MFILHLCCHLVNVIVYFVIFQDDEFTFHGIAYVDMSPLIYPGGLLFLTILKE